MAAKRARTDGLGGGTGDIKPQYLTLRTGTMTPDLYAVNTFALPVPRFGTMKTKATVFELLTLDWYLAVDALLDGSHVTFAFISTSTARRLGEPCTLFEMQEDLRLPVTLGAAMQTNVSNAPTSGALSNHFPVHIDLTDGAGNGVLIATDTITVVAGNVANGVPADTILKMKYRLTNIGIAEYVGIVQSQQVQQN